MAYANEEVLAALRDARKRAGLSQRALAAKVGWPQSHLSRIERGHVDLQLSSLIQLARALGLEPVLVPARQLGAIRSLLAPEAGEARRSPYDLGSEDDDG
ncbi:transcriptional regulator [Allostella vacuolata]|nr:transcriptional regulator [Stella vacuolata]